MLVIKAVIKKWVDKAFRTLELSRKKQGNRHLYPSREEKEKRFFFPSAFDFWNDSREDLYQQYLKEESE